MDKIREFTKKPYVSTAIVILFFVGLAALYHYFPLTNLIALIILAVIIIALIISGNFKEAWSWLKYLLLGLLIGVILTLVHIDWFPWGIPLYLLGVVVLVSQEPDENLLKYMTEMRSFGQSDDEITVNLQKGGWKTHTIKKHLKILKNDK